MQKIIINCKTNDEIKYGVCIEDGLKLNNNALELELTNEELNVLADTLGKFRDKINKSLRLDDMDNYKATDVKRVSIFDSKNKKYLELIAGANDGIVYIPKILLNGSIKVMGENTEYPYGSVTFPIEPSEEINGASCKYINLAFALNSTEE